MADRKRRALLFVTRHRTGLTVLALSALLLAAPSILANPYRQGILNLIAINAIAVLGLNLFIGYAGQISLGHAAFAGLGAYCSAILTVNHGMNPWAALVAAAAATGCIALLIGMPALSLSGHYLAMATLGFNLVVSAILVQWDSLTGGPSGFSGIPSLAVGGFAFASDARLHYVLWGFALVALMLALNLVRSGVGRGMAALAEDEVAASTLGVDVRRSKVAVFVLSAILASVSGSLYAHTYGFVAPSTFGIFGSLDLVLMVVVGGIGSVWGTLFGAGFITLLPHLLTAVEEYKEIVHGLILVLILMFLPEGLITGLVRIWRVRRARRAARAAA
jgi:branched-chain amino acid transport system permease protein